LNQAGFFMGLGYEHGADVGDALALAERCCRQAGLAAADLNSIASIDHKVEDGMIMAIARHFGCGVQFFPATALEVETPRLINPSESVFRAVGCHGVAEAAALAAAGPVASLVIPKTKSGRVTCAIARRGELER
jgi:cobalamin biosynthesis protein CbiG